MRKQLYQSLPAQLALLSGIVFLSRLPFLWAGFGSEEDAWLLPLTAKSIALNSAYQMSRAPGHPLQELIYAWMYNNGLSAFTTNLVSAIASVAATVFFALSVRNLGLRHYLIAGFAFAFTPAIFIASTYTIDYMLAMAFVMGSFYFLTNTAAYPPLEGIGGGKTLIFSGILLGLSIGFRITSAAMLIPFCLFISPIYKENAMTWRRVFLFALTTLLIGLATYLPVLKTYGLTFFTYSDQFPYPNPPKVIYKATIGVFGSIGILAILFFKVQVLLKKDSFKAKILTGNLPVRLFWTSLAAILIYIISYLRLPQKSAYLIPIIPFVILIYGYFLSERAFKIFCILLVASSFIFGMNLTDPLRGSSHSSLSIQFKCAGQEVFIDPLTGPVYTDYTKRLNKIAFTEEIYQKIMKENKKIVLICGWWYNELRVRSWNNQPNANVVPVFYIEKPIMEKYISENYQICYLPEQNLYNDQYSGIHFTDSVAKPYFVNLYHE